MTDREPDPVILALSHVRSRSLGGPLEDVEKGGNVTLNFHPDRLIGDVPILRALASGGTYRSQFETRTSNGASPPTTEVIGGCGRAETSATASSSRRISAYQIGTHCPRSPTPTPPTPPLSAASEQHEPLDDYVEAHVHGVIDLAAPGTSGLSRHRVRRTGRPVGQARDG